MEIKKLFVVRWRLEVIEVQLNKCNQLLDISTKLGVEKKNERKKGVVDLRRKNERFNYGKGKKKTSEVGWGGFEKCKGKSE